MQCDSSAVNPSVIIASACRGLAACVLQFPGKVVMTHGFTRFGSPRGGASLALLAVQLQAWPVPQDGLRVVPLVRDDQVLVTFTLADGFTDEVRAAIQSGLKTSFTYTVDLRLDVPGWVDRTIGTATATSSVEFDNLTRRYDLVRTVDGRVVDSKQTEDEAVVRQWMTVDAAAAALPDQRCSRPTASTTSPSAPRRGRATAPSSGRSAAAPRRRPNSPSFASADRDGALRFPLLCASRRPVPALR